jgi:hypothetical protein
MRPAAELTTSAAEGLPRRRFTIAEVEAMVAAGVMEEDERVELIGGELVPMSPKGNHHEVMMAGCCAGGTERSPTTWISSREQPFASARTLISNRMS